MPGAGRDRAPREWLTLYGGEWPLPPAYQAEVDAFRARRARLEALAEQMGREVSLHFDRILHASLYSGDSDA